MRMVGGKRQGCVTHVDQPRSFFQAALSRARGTVIWVLPKLPVSERLRLPCRWPTMFAGRCQYPLPTHKQDAPSRLLTAKKSQRPLDL
jgi:hypothetical protein